MSNEHNVNLQSVDAMFATLLNEVMQVKTMQREIRDMHERSEQRIAKLERDAETFKARIGGAVALISLVVGVVGFAVQTGLHKVFFRP